VKAFVCVLLAGAASWAQPTALLKTAGVNQLCVRSTQLMEAGGVAIPDLSRAAAPVIENVKQACGQLRQQPGAGQATYLLMVNLRAYLALADAVPKPFPFPDTARLQLAELRDDAARLDSHFRALLDSKDQALRSPDRDNLERYAEDNRKRGRPQPNKPRVVFIGDSITEMWHLNEYFPDQDFINRGIAGQITGQMLGRMKADVIDLHPDLVVIEGGTNDLDRGIRLTAIEDNYTMLADLAAANKIKVIFASVLPVNDYHKDADPALEWSRTHPVIFINALNDWLRSFCAQRGFVYLDYHSALTDEQGQLGQDLSDDGLNPNSKGYRLMAPLAAMAVDKALGPPPPPAKPRKGKEASK